MHPLAFGIMTQRQTHIDTHTQNISSSNSKCYRAILLPILIIHISQSSNKRKMLAANDYNLRVTHHHNTTNECIRVIHCVQIKWAHNRQLFHSLASHVSAKNYKSILRFYTIAHLLKEIYDGCLLLQPHNYFGCCCCCCFAQFRMENPFSNRLTCIRNI